MPGVMQFFSKLRDMSLRLYAESIKREAAFLEAYRTGLNDLQAPIHLPPTENGWLKAAFVELAELASGMNDEKQGGEGPARVPGLGGWTVFFWTRLRAVGAVIEDALALHEARSRDTILRPVDLLVERFVIECYSDFSAK